MNVLLLNQVRVYVSNLSRIKFLKEIRNCIEFSRNALFFRIARSVIALSDVELVGRSYARRVWTGPQEAVRHIQSRRPARRDSHHSRGQFARNFSLIIRIRSIRERSGRGSFRYRQQIPAGGNLEQIRPHRFVLAAARFLL